MREGVWEVAGEEVEGEVKVAEGGAGGDGCREGGVEVVVGEGERGERREAAEGGGKRAGEIGVREVDGGDSAGEVVTEYSSPVARGGVTVVPVGERMGGVGEMEFCLEEEEAFLV